MHGRVKRKHVKNICSKHAKWGLKYKINRGGSVDHVQMPLDVRLTLGHWSVQERLVAFSSSLLVVNWKHFR
jgi:hypothetical protein